ncbi:MAG: GNAT family N-acetyltransferase [Clostridia bacterium]|nr:GNAT family N-acetyltransferase [Clostridia bacterium]
MQFFPTDDLRDEAIFLQLDRHLAADPARQYVPAYRFSICLHDGTEAGVCDLRIGHNERLYIGGNIGYEVFPAHRGHHYAARAVELLKTLARKHGMEYLIITCQPDNPASARTILRAGGEFVETAPVPPWHDMYQRGLTETCVYRIEL